MSTTVRSQGYRIDPIAKRMRVVLAVLGVVLVVAACQGPAEDVQTGLTNVPVAATAARSSS